MLLQATSPLASTQPGVDILQRGKLAPLCIPSQSQVARPLSQATEFYDTDVENEEKDSGSEFEEDSPRDSSGSGTTVSMANEAPTPISPQMGRDGVQLRRTESVQGPRGPHLFRTSFDSTGDFQFDHALQMSPLLPKDVTQRTEAPLRSPMSQIPGRLYSLTTAVAYLDNSDVRNWTSQQVVCWMYASGFKHSVIQHFEAHKVNGAALLGLKFDDLKEQLDIPEFGIRHKLWNDLSGIRADGSISPACTEFQDISRPCTSNTRSKSYRERCHPRRHAEDSSVLITPGGTQRTRVRRYRTLADGGITGGQPVSIVAIEQLIPKPHKCAKGKNCGKWKKQQRLIEQLNNEFAISPTNGGHIFIAGNPGDVEFADNIVENVMRPTSEALFSVVASSDLLGPDQLPEFVLQEDMLRKIEQRDPQENVKHFLSFQHMQAPTDTPPSPPTETPTYEMFPPLHPPISQSAPPRNSRLLPRLEIPARSATAHPTTALSPFRTALSPNIRRFGTPASEMDVPFTDIALPPVSRDASQSVPPNMQFRPQKQHRPGSRDPSCWRRESFTLPTLQEYNSPVSQQERVKAIYGDSTTQAGWMKKRKNKLLRHEWSDNHFRLNGTQLSMYASALAIDSNPLDTIDVENYAVACSSLASHSKLAAALKSLRITAGRKDTRLDDAAFAFQLIPAADRAKVVGLLREGVKTHHFAVKTRDERIDWMREVMLAKAIRQKGDGFEVIINGEMA